jgi:hypothetical protein
MTPAADSGGIAMMAEKESHRRARDISRRVSTGRPLAFVFMALLLRVVPCDAAWHFTDVTAEAGLSYQHGYLTEPGFREASAGAGGVAAGDYDGDGRVDLYVVRGTIGPNLLFHNRGDGTFEEVGQAAAVALTGVRSSGPLFADLDGDGRLDLFVGGVDGTPVSVFRNAGDGTFTDVTAASGIVIPPGRDTFGATAADYDRDGDLDLFLTHWVTSFFDFTNASSFHLWRNDGAGVFTDVTLPAGIVPLGPSDTFDSLTANFADIDGDGWPDLLVTGDFFTTRVYRNNRDGTFAFATDPSVITDGNGMGAAIGDYDGDGDLDWFVSSIWDPNGVAEGNWDTTGNRLYRNRGNGTFEDATDAAGVRVGYWGWGSTFQDLDNDGDLDLFEVNGFGRADIPETAEFVADPSRLFVNDGAGTFVERAAELGVADTDQGRGVVAFDYDGDGDLDLFVHDSEGPGRLYRNDGGNVLGWLDVSLRGRAPNIEGIGARIRVTANGRTQLREVRAGSNYVSQDPAVAHFGLGTAPTATVEVIWLDGTRSVREKVAANQRLVLDQPPPGVDEQTRQQQDCIVALNTAGARFANTVGKRFVGCVRDGTRGALPPGPTAQECLTADPRVRLAAAAAKTADAAARKCPLVPAFGPAAATAVNAAMAGVLRPQDVFGPDLDVALLDVAVDPAGARCQTAVARTLAKLAMAKLKAFNACKAAGLRRGTIRSQADLASCHDAMAGAAIAKAVASGQKATARSCAGIDLARALPGRCAGASPGRLDACLEEQAACSACMALDGADRLGTPCHRFQDGVATLYCGDRPATDQSIARQWDELLLDAIRRDTPRPTVHARNLFHLSAAMWDAWRAYGGGGSAWLTDESHPSADPTADRAAAISFAAFRLLAHRFAGGPGAVATQAKLRRAFYAFGFDEAFTSTTGDSPAAVGNRIAAAMIAFGMNDGANEAGNYGDPTYTPANPPLVVKQPGTIVTDPNRWQPLALDLIISQNGIPLPGKVQTAIGARWNQVTPFALTRSDPTDVYVDPGPPPRLGFDDAGYLESARRVVELESYLTADDGAMIDISPGAIGNNALGTNDGTGHPVNPFTGEPYAPNVVPRGDFGRVLAEFWADGPNSETPPGHWNVLANEVSDHPLTTHQIGGTGPVLDRLEWDVKLYFALNGAVHDAAITAWGLKRKYDSVRPITMIRYAGGLGQSSDPGGWSYHPRGLPLQPGLIEVITAATTAPGERHANLAGHEGEIAVRAWAGEPAAPATQVGGIGWRRAVEWVPYQRKTFVTPAFPGYTSGHSTFSRAAAEVLARFTGTPFFPGGLGEFHARAHEYLTFEDGPSVDTTLQWATFYDAADLAGQSRLWGGIHISQDDFNGRITGSQVGIGAFTLAERYFAGTIGRRSRPAPSEGVP